MPLHLDEFQRAEFQGYVEEVPSARDYALARFYPVKQVFDTEFVYNVISGGYGQMASITAFDGTAPLRDKDVLARMTGELAKVQHSYRLTEKELLQYNRPRMEAEQKQVVDAVYDQTDKLVFGVRDREEWLRGKATYTGIVEISENGVDATIDFGIPEENKVGVGADWVSDANAPVLEHLRGAVDQFKESNNGQLPEEMHMSGRVETLLLKNSQIKAQIYGNSTDGRIVTRDQLGQLFGSLEIPPYKVISDSFIGDSKVAEKIMPEDRIVFIGGSLGKTLIGPTVENNYEPGIYVIPEIKETNPPRQEVFVGETMFTALERPSAIVHLIVTPVEV